MRRQVSFILFRALLVVALTMGLHTSATATDFIKDVMLIGGSSSEVNNLKTNLTGEGWNVIDVDLNKGCGSGSDYIYLLYKSESNANNYNLGYITDFYISDRQEDIPDVIMHNGLTYHLVSYDGSTDFKNSKGDLNRSVGGATIHLYYTKEVFHDNRTVSSIEFKTGKDNATGALGVNGNTTPGYDLNSGAGGDFIYMHVSTSAATPVINVTIGDESNTGSLYGLPLNLDKDYSFSQQILYPEEIGLTGTITAISFHRDRSNLGAFSMEGVRVYLQYTDRDSFSSNMDNLDGEREPISLRNPAYEGLFSAAEGSEWLTVTLNHPFEYDGHSNLLITVYDPTPGYSAGSFGFTCHEVSAKRFYSLWCNAYYINDNEALSFDAFFEFGSYFYNPEDLCWTRVNDIRLCIVASSYLPRPLNPVLTDVTDKTATLSWDAPGGAGNSITGYAYQYKKVSEAVWSDEARVSGSSTSVVLTGLSSFTDYDFRVKALYGNKESVTVSTSFTTLRGLPYEWGFENGYDGWERVNWYWGGDNETVNWLNYTGIRSRASHDGDLGFQFQSSSPGSDNPQYLISPPFSGTDPMIVSFYYRGGYMSYPEKFQVGYSTTTNELNAFIWGDVITMKQRWAKYEDNTIPMGTRYVAIKYVTSYERFFIDDIFFDAYSSYAKPTNLSARDLTEQSATISWTSPGNVTGYVYQYRKLNDSTWSSEATVNATSVTLDNLPTNTGYLFRIKALYTGGNTSSYATLRFMTEVPKESIPHYQDFENGMGGWRVLMGFDNTGIETINSNNFFVFDTPSASQNQYLISPLIDASTGIRFTFSYKSLSAGYHADFRVGYTTQASKDIDTDSWVWSKSLTSDNGWLTCTGNLPADTKYFAIKWEGPNSMAVDDISLVAWEDNLTVTKATFYGEEKYLASFYDKTLNYDLPEGSAAYTVAQDGSELVFLRIGDGNSRSIPAGTPVIVVADKESSDTSDTKNLSLTLSTGSEVSARPGNILLASDIPIAVTEGKIGDKTVYVLGVKNGVPGFYQFEGNEIPAGKAYILK